MAGASSDAELYLRLLAERCLLDGEGAHPRGGSVSSAAAALLAIGAVRPDVADEIVSDYGQACFLRNRGGPGLVRPPGAGPATRTVRPIGAPRVVALDCDLDLAGASLHVQYVSLGQDATTIGITAVQLKPGVVPGPPVSQPQLADDQGNVTVANFSGGGGPAGYEGVLTSQSPLSRDTRWIEIGTARLDLGPGVAAAEVRLERLPERDPALAHLWNRLASAHHLMPMPGADIDAAIDALIAVGALDPASQELSGVRDVAAVFGGPAAWRGPYASWGTSGAKPAGLPEPWAALAATRSRPPGQGPTGAIAIAAVTAPIDGTIVVVEALISKPDAFQISVFTTPGTAIGGPSVPAAGDPLAWWAEDDQGGVYLGGPSNWGGGPDHSRGTIQFFPPLTPDLKELRVMPTGRTERAVIVVPLTWGDRP